MLDPYMNDWSHGPNLSVTPKVSQRKVTRLQKHEHRTSISASSASLSVELSLLSSRYICLQMHNDLSTFYQRLAGAEVSILENMILNENHMVLVSVLQCWLFFQGNAAKKDVIPKRKRNE